MNLPSLDEVVAVYSNATPSAIGQAEHRMFERYGIEPLLPMLVRAYPHLRRSQGRAAVLFSLPRYARTNPAVVDLAIRALEDRAFIVR
jgi:hypothetical protein